MLRQRLLFRIRRHYPTRTSSLRLGGREFVFTRVADPDAVLDDVARAEDLRRKLAAVAAPVGITPAPASVAEELPLPYWAELWDSAMGLGQFLLRDCASDQIFQMLLKLSPKARPPRALDLGCGMGLAGTVAAALGYEVTFADRQTPALLLARYNALGVAHPCRIHTRQCDWRTDSLGQHFHLILGADILYNASQWPYLQRFWKEHLFPEGRLLLAEPGRQSGEAFITWIAQYSWKVQLHSEHLLDHSTPIRLIELQSQV
jgi:SAM-dependent methyltransferase